LAAAFGAEIAFRTHPVSWAIGLQCGDVGMMRCWDLAFENWSGDTLRGHLSTKRFTFGARRNVLRRAGRLNGDGLAAFHFLNNVADYNVMSKLTSLRFDRNFYLWRWRFRKFAAGAKRKRRFTTKFGTHNLNTFQVIQ
jgi:hypothetical protein